MTLPTAGPANMFEACHSPHEIERLKAVQEVRLLGTPAEERFDRITRLARRLFKVPMAALDIVSENVTWLKSVQGFDGIATPRKDSYCHHAVQSDDICLVPDARVDPRVSNSGYADTWVFYAGVALHFRGQRVGVLCIGDTQPRQLESEHLEALRDLAALAEQEFEVAELSEAQVALALSNEELRMKAHIDVLTHVWNRGAILQVLANSLANPPRETAIAALMIDVDHFKQINDEHGHLVGDQVLRVVSERLRKALRPVDALGRYGGEEFLAVLANVNAHQAAEICRRICETVAGAPIHCENAAIRVSCSVGCVVSEGVDDLNAIIQRADGALYRAKTSGRNRIEIDG